MGNFFIRLKVG